MIRLPTWLLLAFSIAGATMAVVARKLAIAESTGAAIGKSFASPSEVIVEIGHCAMPFLVLALFGIRLPICWIVAVVLTTLFQLWFVNYWTTLPIGGGFDFIWVYMAPGSVIGITVAALLPAPFFVDATPRES